jgi:eukaryotic-like serine/threonine-protein kinase
MDPDTWQILQQHFDALCDLPASDRPAALDQLGLDDELKAQLEQLLSFDGVGDLDEVAGKVGKIANGLDGSELPGQMIGAYRLIRLLGEGGMGEVYLAERADGRFESQVAIKFLAAMGRQSERLFDRERRILARLNHPDIARMIDAGEHPRFGAYLVMEYVDGLALNEYLSRRGEGTIATLRWLGRAALAVAYAHQNLILHRDLKPDHLMVTEAGQLKVLDFGVATLLDPQAESGEQTIRRSFTPRYAAPEQLLDQASTTRTDVYALGLILYELLSQGQSPFGEDAQQLAERKLAAQATPLGRVPGLRPRQVRDVSAIIDKAIARDPDQRYAGPADLASDLEAIVDDRPIALRHPSRLERSWRWMARHRLVAASLMIAVLALLAGTVLSTWFGYQAQRERDAALIEARKAQVIAGFLESIFQTASPGIDRGPDLRARDLLEQGRVRMEQELADEPLIAAVLEISMARSYLNLGMYQEGLALVEAQRPELPASVQARRQILAARLEIMIGELERSLQRLESIDFYGVESIVRAEAEAQRATALLNLGNSASARAAIEEAMALADDSEAGLVVRLSVQSLLGAMAYGQGDLAEAKEIYSEVHRLSRLRHGELNGQTAMALNNLGGVAFMSGDLDTAINAYSAAIDTYEKLFGVDNRAVALALRGLGLSYRRMGMAAEAEQTLRRSANAFAGWNGRENWIYQEVVIQLLELLVLLDRHEEMLALLVDLPEVELPGGRDSRGVVCRLSRFHQVYAGQPAAQPDCLAATSLPEYVKVFDLFLQTVEAGHSAPDRFEQARSVAREATATLVPPDPLLALALERLQIP